LADGQQSKKLKKKHPLFESRANAEPLWPKRLREVPEQNQTKKRCINDDDAASCKPKKLKQVPLFLVPSTSVSKSAYNNK